MSATCVVGNYLQTWIGDIMRTTATLAMLVMALLAAPALLAQGDEAEEQKGVNWTENYEEALKTAKADEKRLFLEFTATW